MYKNKLTYVIKTNDNKKTENKTKKTSPLFLTLLLKCYKRHRFLPRRHLCLPFTRIIHRSSERSSIVEGREEERTKKKTDCSEAQHRLCVKKQQQQHNNGEKSKRSDEARDEQNVQRSVVQTAKWSLRRSKADRDREGLHTPLFI